MNTSDDRLKLQQILDLLDRSIRTAVQAREELARIFYGEEDTL